MAFVYRYRIPALFCALAVLLCELLAHPYANMGVCDDGPYILTAQTLAATGHVIYNGWPSPILGWQLYLAAAFIKLFGFSFSVVRMSTLFVSVLIALLLQRTLVRAGITERNATLGTLAFVLSPLYLMLSATYMTDITGLFGILICLYGCLRALQSTIDRSTLAWLCFAVIANALFGSSRQIAWLGILIMIPSALYLLRNRRRVLIAGAIADFAGVLFIVACIHWFGRQPYVQPEHLLPDGFPVAHILGQCFHTFLDFPFLLLPIAALFLPQMFKGRPRLTVILSTISLIYIGLAFHWRHAHPDFLLEPTQHDWLNVYGVFEKVGLHGNPPTYLHAPAQILLTVLAIGGLLGFFASLLRTRQTPVPSTSAITPRQLTVLIAPYALAYILLLIPRAATNSLFDRYVLGLLLVAVLCLVRYYQDRIHPRIPLAGVILVAIMALYGIAVTHNMFALYRARVAMADEIRSAGIPETSVDNGWEYNFLVELQHANHINDDRIEVPAHAYTPAPPLPTGSCLMRLHDNTPHIVPLYSVSFDPTACYGLAPFAPVQFSRWPYRTPGTLYVVRSVPPRNP